MSACAGEIALIAPGSEIHRTSHATRKRWKDDAYISVTAECGLPAIAVIARDTCEDRERCGQPTQSGIRPPTCSLPAFISSTHSRPHAAARVPSVATASPSSEATPATASRSLRAEADRP